MEIKILLATIQIEKQILCLNYPTDDDLHKIYLIKSENRRKYYQVIATVFGATSCSCIEQTKNPYKSCNHMKLLDQILENSPDKI